MRSEIFYPRFRLCSDVDHVTFRLHFCQESFFLRLWWIARTENDIKCLNRCFDSLLFGLIIVVLPDVMLRLWFVLYVLRSLLMLMLRHLLIQVNVTTTRTCFAVAVANSHATNNVLSLSPLRWRAAVTATAVRLTARMSLVRILNRSRRWLSAVITKLMTKN